MRHPRTIEVKTLLNADEFSDLKRACEAEDVPQSALLRHLTKEWLRNRNDSQARVKAERPACGHVQAMFLPGRRPHYGVAHVRMRL
jgi:hypothetical protein